MTRVQKLEQEIKELSSSELAAFREWFQEYDATEWDRQIQDDAIAGKFDKLAKKALADHKAGRTREI
ncbi:MAG: hypothetical protein HY913_17155 [Desulfomonile tiedjei]|nr:hypothetical protein [Desulfomonile tiedjei]